MTEIANADSGKLIFFPSRSTAPPCGCAEWWDGILGTPPNSHDQSFCCYKNTTLPSSMKFKLKTRAGACFVTQNYNDPLSQTELHKINGELHFVNSPNVMLGGQLALGARGTTQRVGGWVRIALLFYYEPTGKPANVTCAAIRAMPAAQVTRFLLLRI